MNDLEDRLAAHLHGQATRATGTGHGGWEGIYHRIRVRSRRRQRLRAATALGLVVVVAGLTVGRDRLADRDGLATGPAAGPVAALPRLVVDLPGWELVHASESVNTVEAQDSAGRGVLQAVLVDPARGFDGPALFVTAAPAGATYGAGDRSETARVVDVNGNRAWLQDMTVVVKNLGWHLPTGQTVNLVALRLTDDQVLAAGRALAVGPDGTLTWSAGAPPDGLAVESLTVVPTEMLAASEVNYEQGGASVSLRLLGGGTAQLVQRVADRVASAAEVRAAQVEGVPAVLTRYEGEDTSSLMWEVRQGVAAELVLSGVPAGMEATATASRIREVDEAAWQQVLDRGARRPAADAPLAGDAEQLAAVANAMCEHRNAWLAGEPGAEQELRNLRRHALEIGLDRNTDLVAVMDRLLAAMSTGDAVKVRTIPEGGGCR